MPLERTAARICREAGARVAENVLLRDLNLDAPVLDDRRLEVVANALLIWGGVQVAVDTTVVSPVRADGAPRPGPTANPALPCARSAAASALSSSRAGAAACSSSVSRLAVGGSRFCAPARRAKCPSGSRRAAHARREPAAAPAVRGDVR